MEIPRKLLDQLTKELNAFSAAGRQMVLNAIANVEWNDVAELRAIMIEVMEMVCGEMTDMAAARSAEFYDGVRSMSVGSKLGALAESGRKPAATEGAVRALVKSVVDSGSTERFARELGDRVDYEIKKAASDCVEFNADRDPIKPRFARVPSGAETCSFCNMLASRGFVYHTNKTAEGRYHGHPGCDCRVVPGFDTYEAGPSRRFSASTSVEGYEPDKLYGRYVDDLKSGKLNVGATSRKSSHVLNWGSDSFGSYSDIVRFIDKASDIEDLQQRCAVVEQEWDSTGLSNKYWSQLRMSVIHKRHVFERGDGVDNLVVRPDGAIVGEWLGRGSSGIATLETRAIQPHEFNAYRVLMDQGQSFTVKAVDMEARWNGKSSPDVSMEGSRWELKCPQGGNPKKTIARNINKAIRQMKNADPPAKSVKIILSCLETDMSTSDILFQVNRKMKEGEIDEMLIILSETDMRVLKK